VIFHAPQVIWIMLMTASMVIGMHQHGQPKKGTEDAWITLMAIIVNFGLLFWGGFFG